MLALPFALRWDNIDAIEKKSGRRVECRRSRTAEETIKNKSVPFSRAITVNQWVMACMS